MGYLADSMGEGEVVVLESRISLWMFAKEICIVLVLLYLEVQFFRSAILGVIIALAALAIYVSYTSAELAVTNRRVLAKFGLISRQVVEVRASKIEGVTINQSITGRLLDYGTIVISGSGGTAVPIPCVRDPLGFRRAIDTISNK